MRLFALRSSVALVLVASAASAAPEPAPPGSSSAATTSDGAGQQPAAPGETAATPAPEVAAASTALPAAPADSQPPAPDALQSDDSGAAAQLDDEQSGATDSVMNGEALKLYGFGDVGYRQMLVPKTSPWLVYFNRHPSLFVGHLNFYFDSQLAERWRALAEVRFTYLPQGSWRPDDAGTVRHYDSHGADYTDFTRDRPLGSLMIERAFIEYSATSWLTVQAGQYLTPYGVWNIDHGSPVIIGVTPPFLVGARLLPESQVGLLGTGRGATA